MREINPNEMNFRSVDNPMNIPQMTEAAAASEAAASNTVAGTNNLSLSPEAVLGRSQVQFSGKAANVEADMNVMMANPEAVNKANAFFDNAYAQLKKNGHPNAYEEAANLTAAYKKEFLD